MVKHRIPHRSYTGVVAADEKRKRHSTETTFCGKTFTNENGDFENVGCQQDQEWKWRF